jgi:hypothetical protein
LKDNTMTLICMPSICTAPAPLAHPCNCHYLPPLTVLLRQLVLSFCAIFSGKKWLSMVTLMVKLPQGQDVQF